MKRTIKRFIVSSFIGVITFMIAPTQTLAQSDQIVHVADSKKPATTPDIKGTTWGFWFEDLAGLAAKQDIVNDLMKKGVRNFVQPAIESTGDHCTIPGKPVICVHVFAVKKLGSLQVNGTFTSFGGGGSSSSSQSGVEDQYAMDVYFYLFPNDGSANSMFELASMRSTFSIMTGSIYESSSGPFGGQSYSATGVTQDGEKAIKKATAKGANKLINEKTGWSLDAGERLAQAFKR